MSVKPHRNLLCWSKGIAFVKAVYLMSKAFPSEEKYGLTSQLRRASVSIPTNIAEGAGRKSTKEFTYFLNVAIGSIAEVDTLLTIALELNFISDENCQKLIAELDTIGKLTYGLSQKIASS